MYDVEKCINNYGLDKVKDLIFKEGLSQVELHKAIGLSNSNKRISHAVYARLFSLLNIDGLPYPNLKSESRKFKLRMDLVNNRFWEDPYLVDRVLLKLDNPILNIAEGSRRYVIAINGHPRASSAGQVKAHEALWELYNKQFVPGNHWVIPIDADYTNLDINNYNLVNTTQYKSNHFKGEGNPAYKHGLAQRPKLGGWTYRRDQFVKTHNYCKLCSTTEDLVVHHIINYHLFGDPIEAHRDHNLVTFCNSCHTKVHGNNLNIKVLIEETQYSKLLELLETLKSQVPDDLMETYRCVEKQLGLTDNQQPSP